LITDVFRSRPLLCTIHHLINFTLASVENVPVVPAVLDKGQADPFRSGRIGAALGQNRSRERVNPRTQVVNHQRGSSARLDILALLPLTSRRALYASLAGYSGRPALRRSSATRSTSSCLASRSSRSHLAMVKLGSSRSTSPAARRASSSRPDPAAAVASQT
jgi:hypothetical protein